MLSKDDLMQLSGLLDEKFEVHDARLRQELREEMAQNMAQLREEMAQSAAQLREEMAQNTAQLREETALGISQLRGEMNKNNTLLKKQMEFGFAQVNARLAHVESEVAQLKTDVHNINLTIDKEIRPKLDFLIETFIPEARRFSKAADENHAMKADIEVLNLTVSKHSKILSLSAAT